jgi:hypothetical protein
MVAALLVCGCGQDARKKMEQEKIEQHQQDQMKRMG